MRQKSMARAGLLALVLAAVFVTTAFAATIVSENQYVVSAGETVEGDYYAFAEKVLIEGTIKGDLIAAGSEIEIAPTGVVEQDLIAAGQSVVVEGRVGDDIRVAGFVVRVGEAGGVGDDALAAAYSVELKAGSEVVGDLLAGGWQVVLNGDVRGDARLGCDRLEFLGSVGGDLEAEVGEDQAGPPAMFFPGMPAVDTIASGLTVGDEATVGGRFKVVSPSKISVPDRVAESVEVVEREVSEEAAEEKVEEPEQPWIVRWLISAIKHYIALAIIGLILLWLIPKLMAAAAAIIDTELPLSAGWGCLTLLAALVAALVLGIATILLAIVFGLLRIDPLMGPLFSTAILLGTAITFGLYLLTWAAKVVASAWIGRLIIRNPAPGSAMEKYGPLLVGLVVFVVLANLPQVGFLFSWIGVILGLGAIALATRPHWPVSRTPAEAPAVPEEPV